MAVSTLLMVAAYFTQQRRWKSRTDLTPKEYPWLFTGVSTPFCCAINCRFSAQCLGQSVEMYLSKSTSDFQAQWTATDESREKRNHVRHCSVTEQSKSINDHHQEVIKNARSVDVDLENEHDRDATENTSIAQWKPKSAALVIQSAPNNESKTKTDSPFENSPKSGWTKIYVSLESYPKARV
jgi:hypothetical protein